MGLALHMRGQPRPVHQPTAPEERLLAHLSEEGRFARALLLRLIETADVRRLGNGHVRLVMPVTLAEIDLLSQFGAEAAECEDGDPVEEIDPGEDSDDEDEDPGEADHRDNFGLGELRAAFRQAKAAHAA